MNKTDYVEYLTEVEEQHEHLYTLMQIRNNNQEDFELFQGYLNAGIIYSKDFNHYSSILAEFGVDLVEQGFNKPRLFEEGYMIPCYDHVGDTIFYINYSNKRGPKYKYLMVYPQNKELREALTQIKVYGLEDTLLAHKEDRLFVVEGPFDRLRLKSQGVPAIATLGTKVTQYARNYMARFGRVYYIGDNDDSGKKSFKQLRDNGLLLNKQYVPSGKDVDDFGKENPEEFRNWVAKMR